MPRKVQLPNKGDANTKCGIHNCKKLGELADRRGIFETPNHNRCILYPGECCKYFLSEPVHDAMSCFIV